jgi:ribosomal-protein-serine acetyltransferase
VTTERTALSTGRLRLEPVGPRHTNALFEAVAESSAELRPWLFWAVDYSLDKSRQFTRRCADLWGVAEWTFAICESDQLIGCVGLDSYEPFLSRAEIGYWLRTDRAGRGLMTEAAGAVVDFAFGELKLHRIELHADTRNAASI